MNIDDLLAGVSSGGKKAKKGKKAVNADVSEFVGLLQSANLRITYSGATMLAREEGGVEKILQFAVPSVYPASFQPHICRNNGGYHENAPSKWSDDAPSVDVLEKMDLISDGAKVIALFRKWKSDPDLVKSKLESR